MKNKLKKNTKVEKIKGKLPKAHKVGTTKVKVKKKIYTPKIGTLQYIEMPSPIKIESYKEKKVKNFYEPEIRYLTPLEIETKPENKYCFFKKNNIKYIDFKNPSFLMKFLNERGEILPRRITGTSKKFQKKLKRAIKKCKHIGLLPYLTDGLR
ncbi:30S ribosomal protein S18 [Candidatus Karelsulcia muelleri]|uniref:30S ribosomal protein S18 n=1 Tax=Candidatus Karelsulcia muelleri TaxID=336810 RepID=UPI000B92C99D|nr:30S ribosomal protein S18 [Candidatus Karelsulcia muelleri]ASS46924.1 30S ribosomal protein S18 [Candidatus Karelsulcia muelleri]